MQRNTYPQPVPPAQSPPLHHPVPQHVSSVPQFRSPPPPSQSQNSYGYGGQPQPQAQQGGFTQPPFGQFINDPTAQMGFQMGQTAVRAGQEYMEQSFGRYVNVSAVKHYFNVSNSYVVNKLFLVLFPWRHRPWSRRQAMGPNGQDGYFLPPRDDVNSPDMYIPVMAYVTYILLSAVLAGLRGSFRPEIFGVTATTSIVAVILEIVVLKFGCYIQNISNESQLLDLIAYSGYKFVGVIVTICVSEVFNGGQGTGGWVGWTTFFYTFGALAFFLLRSMKYVLLPENSAGAAGGGMQTVARSQRNRRTQFLFVYAFVVQLALMGLLTRQDKALPTTK